MAENYPTRASPRFGFVLAIVASRAKAERLVFLTEELSDDIRFPFIVRVLFEYAIRGVANDVINLVIIKVLDEFCFREAGIGSKQDGGIWEVFLEELDDLAIQRFEHLPAVRIATVELDPNGKAVDIHDQRHETVDAVVSVEVMTLLSSVNRNGRSVDVNGDQVGLLGAETKEQLAENRLQGISSLCLQ